MRNDWPDQSPYCFCSLPLAFRSGAIVPKAPLVRQAKGVHPAEEHRRSCPLIILATTNRTLISPTASRMTFLTALSQVSDLKVISRNSVMCNTGAGKETCATSAEALGVAYLLEGSVRRAADKVRITAQLIDARTDQHVWAENYDRDLADVFAIQSEVAQRSPARLKANISPSEKAAIDMQPTRDMEAF